MSRHGAKSRYNFKRDRNEQPIIETLEARGFSVTQINGKGAPDLMVTKWGQLWLIEVKQPKGKLNQNQHDFRERWQGPQIYCLRTVEEALTFQADGIEVRPERKERTA